MPLASLQPPVLARKDGIKPRATLALPHLALSSVENDVFCLMFFWGGPLQACEQKGFSVRAQAVESCPSNAPRNAPSAAVGGVLSESLEVGTIFDKLVTGDQWSSTVLRQMPFA